LAQHCWIRLESSRLGRSFPSARSYAEDPIDKCPGSSAFRNFALNLRIDGFRPGPRANPWRHPRQRVLHSLALLLWEPAARTDPKIQQRLRMELNTRAGTSDEWLAAYRALWSRVQ